MIQQPFLQLVPNGGPAYTEAKLVLIELRLLRQEKVSGAQCAIPVEFPEAPVQLISACLGNHVDGAGRCQLSREIQR